VRFTGYGYYPDLNTVWFSDENNGWAGGFPGGSVMLHTSDGGATWDLQSHGCSQTIEGLYFSDATHGWAVGYGGTILHYLAPADAEPPVTEDDAPGGWRNTSVTLKLTPADAGTGPALTRYRLDGGSWEVGTRVAVEADLEWPFDGEGEHLVEYYSVDHAGNREAAKTATVRFDTQRPWTQALAAVTVYRGAAARLRYKVNDAVPNGGTADVTIRIKNSAGKAVKTFTLPGQPVNTALRQRFVCTLPRGTYRYFVSAVDAAGNRQYSIGKNFLYVK
jgi:hypothetical protein